MVISNIQNVFRINSKLSPQLNLSQLSEIKYQQNINK